VYVHGPRFLLLKTTPEQQLAAWLFLKWFTEPEQQARWVSTLSYFPVRASTADLLQDFFAANPQYQRAFGFLGYDSASEPDVTGYNVCRAAIHEMLTAVADGEDAEARLAIAATECNNSLPH
jgi:multiple sugar transport system substrate-binding protein/sn-glycerol 3-phosphate transport system substrate-binding protein